MIVSHYIPVRDFLIHSINGEKYIYYLIAIDLTSKYSKYLKICSDDDRYIEVDLKISIHMGKYTAIKYDANLNGTFRLPRISLNVEN